MVLLQNSDSFGDIIEQDPVSFSFDAPGWYLLIALIGLALIASWIILQLKHKRNAYRRRAISELRELSVTSFDYQLIIAVNQALRRIVLRWESRSKVASLQGSEWIGYLNSQCSSILFNEDSAGIIEKAVYQEAEIEKTEVDQFFESALLWISKHRAK